MISDWLDQIFKVLLLFHFHATLALMSSTSVLLTPSQGERRGSKGTRKNERVKHKVEKVKQLHRTSSGREPKQKKKLKKEELQPYAREDVEDIMSNVTNEDDSVTPRLSQDDFNFIHDPSVSGSPYVDLSFETEFTSQSSSLDVNLSQPGEGQSSIQVADEEMMRKPQFLSINESAISSKEISTSKKSGKTSDDFKKNESSVKNKKRKLEDSSRNQGKSREASSKDKRDENSKTSRSKVLTAKQERRKSSVQFAEKVHENFTTVQNEALCAKCSLTQNVTSLTNTTRRKKESRPNSNTKSIKNDAAQPNNSPSERAIIFQVCPRCGKRQPMPDNELRKFNEKFKQAVQDIIREKRKAKMAERNGDATKKQMVRTSDELRASKSYASVTKSNLGENEDSIDNTNNLDSAKPKINIIEPSIDSDGNRKQSIQNLKTIEMKNVDIEQGKCVCSTKECLSPTTGNEENPRVVIELEKSQTSSDQMLNSEISMCGINRLYQSSNSQSIQNSEGSTVQSYEGSLSTAEIKRVNQNSEPSNTHQNSEASSIGIKYLYQNSNSSVQNSQPSNKHHNSELSKTDQNLELSNKYQKSELSNTYQNSESSNKHQNSKSSSIGLKYLYQNPNSSVQNSESSSMGIKLLYQNSSDSSHLISSVTSNGPLQNSDGSLMNFYQNSRDFYQNSGDFYQNSKSQYLTNSVPSSKGTQRLYHNSNLSGQSKSQTDQNSSIKSKQDSNSVTNSVASTVGMKYNLVESSKNLDQSYTNNSEMKESSEININTIDKTNILTTKSKNADGRFVDEMEESRAQSIQPPSNQNDQVQLNFFNSREKVKDLVGKEFPNKICTLTQLLNRERHKYAAIVRSVYGLNIPTGTNLKLNAQFTNIPSLTSTFHQSTNFLPNTTQSISVVSNPQSINTTSRTQAINDISNTQSMPSHPQMSNLTSNPQSMNATSDAKSNDLQANQQSTNTKLSQQGISLSNAGSFVPFCLGAFPISMTLSGTMSKQELLTVDADLVNLNSRVNSLVQAFIQDMGILKPWMYELSFSASAVNVNLVHELWQEIFTADRETSEMVEGILAYYAHRNNVVSDILKYSFLQNEQSENLLETMNQKHHVDLQIMISKLRHKYIVLHYLVSSILPL